MKRLLSLIAVAALSVATIFAQEKTSGYWYMQIQGGAAHTVGEADFGDLISPAGALSLGYQFSPVFGARLNVNGWQGKGALVNPTTTYKFNFVEGGIDLTMDLCNLFGEKRADRLFNPYILGGLGANFAFNNDDANDLAARFPSENHLWDGTLVKPSSKAGVGLNIRLSRVVALNLEANTSFLSDKFNSKDGSYCDYQIAGLAGLTIKFGQGGKAVAPVAPVAPVAQPAPAPKPEPKPEPEPEKVVETAPAAPAFEGLTENVYFLINKWDIRPSEQAKIDEIVEVMNANPDAKIRISGHADKATGNERINRFLSEKRCTVVAQALEAAGIAKDRITTEYFGDTANPYKTPEENRVAVCVVK